MVKGNFKQIDLLRKRRDSNYFLVEPNFIDKKKFIYKGIFSGSIIIIFTLILHKIHMKVWIGLTLD